MPLGAVLWWWKYTHPHPLSFYYFQSYYDVFIYIHNEESLIFLSHVGQKKTVIVHPGSLVIENLFPLT